MNTENKTYDKLHRSHSEELAAVGQAGTHIEENEGVCLFPSLTGPVLQKHTPSRMLATAQLLQGPSPTACWLGEDVTW